MAIPKVPFRKGLTAPIRNSATARTLKLSKGQIRAFGPSTSQVRSVGKSRAKLGIGGSPALFDPRKR